MDDDGRQVKNKSHLVFFWQGELQMCLAKVKKTVSTHQINQLNALCVSGS